MTELLYLKDSYLRDCTARVLEAQGTRIVLDRTVFYPTGGGQPCDSGKISYGGIGYGTVEVRKEAGRVVHTVERDGLKAGDEVRCEINWERRYALMRMHTAAHVLGSTMFKSGYAITGNQLGEAESRFDFSMENFDRAVFDSLVAKANGSLRQPVELKVYELPREQALAIPEVVKLATALPPQIDFLRIVEIPGIDVQADGGTHVRSLREVGQINVSKLENKGAKNKRVYFSLMQ